MNLFEKTASEQKRIDEFLNITEKHLEKLEGYEEYVQTSLLKGVREDLLQITNNFYRNDRKLNIGIIGQVKAGKSTFLNTLLFDGKPVLPTARTPKTAALTKIEYSKENRICVEYYDINEWRTLEKYAQSEIEDNEHTVARETMQMVAESGINPYTYIEKQKEDIAFPSLEELMGQLNEYVGENGKFTPMVRNVTLCMDKPELAEISVVDTPGMNDAIASRTDRTRNFIKNCDVVFFLSKGSQFLDANDMQLLSKQIPQEGIANLILISSQFDAALLDELRKCGSLRATIDKIKPKLINRAKETFKQNCPELIFISSLVNNMSDKQESEFNKNEALIYKRLNRYGDLTPELMREIGNIKSVKDRFTQITENKDSTLQERARNFVPNSKDKWNSAVRKLKAETERRRNALESGDKETLEKQKKIIESQISGIRASLEIVLGDLKVSLEQTKNDILKKLRDSCRENSRIQEKTGTEQHTRCHKVTTGHLWWKKSHYEYSDYTTTYTYLLSSDALENIRSFGFDSCSQIESAFYKAVDIKATKRKLMQTILDNFDSSDENFDINHFKYIMESTLNKIEFPVVKLDVTSFIQSISSQFSGEVRNSAERAKLQELLSETMDKLFDNVSGQFEKSIASFRTSLNNMQSDFSSQLLEQIQNDFETLCGQLEDKTNAVEKYQNVIDLLCESEIK